jgi:hypothetical protein
MRKRMRICIFLFFLLILKSASGEWKEVLFDFEQDFGGFSGYRGNEILQQSKEFFYSGNYSLKVETKGEDKLEGIQKSINVEPDNTYIISSYMKGTGKVMLCSYGSLGWTYGKQIELKDEWQKVEIEKYEKGNLISIYILTASDKPQKATFFVDDIKIEKEKIPVLSSVDVKPLLFEAEDYPGNSKVIKETIASGGAFTEGTRWYWLAKGIPFPNTLKNVFIYLKVWIDDNRENYFYIWAKGNEIYRQKLSFEKKWIWIKTGPFNYRQIGKEFNISSNGPSQSAVARLDAIIITTEDLSEEELKYIEKKYNLISEKGVITLGYTDVPPVVDGNLNDTCWKNSIEIGNFVLMNSNTFAKEKTKVYLTYDRKNLYVGFICEEDCLNPVNNQLSGFKKNCKENDNDGIFNDDCVVILINPENSPNSFYDIFINGSGSINDAFCKGKDPNELWSSRDKKWDSKANVKTNIDNGKWSVELSVPFSSFGKVPSEGDMWSICLGRIEQFRKETSSWQPMSIGFHNLSDFGYIIFLKDTIGIHIPEISDFYLGKNKLNFKFDTLTKVPLRIETSIGFKDKKEIFYNDYILNKDKEISHEFDLNKEGDFKIRYKILDPASFNIFYASPVYSLSVKSSILKASIKSSYPYRIYLNGEEFKEKGYLSKGPNIIGIEAKGPLSGEFIVGDLKIPIDGTWKFSSKEEVNWNQKEFDDTSWKYVEMDGVQTKGAGYLRKVLLLNYTMFWPNWNKEGLNIAQNSVQQLHWVVEGLENKKLNELTLFLEVPRELKVIGASGYYKIRKYSVIEGDIIKKDGEEFRKYEVKAESPVSFQKDPKLWQDCIILIECPLYNKKTTNFYYYIKSDKGYICEIPQRLKVNILPPVNGKQPKKYVLQLWTGWLSSVDNPLIEEHMLKFLARTGINEICTTTHKIASELNIKRVRLIDFNVWNIDCRPYLKENPEDALIDFKGAKRYKFEDARNNQICTTLLLNDTPAWKFVENSIKEWIEKYNIDHINWDYESNVFESYISCYCDRCLKEFKKFARVPEGKKLTPEVIKKEYKNEWIEFMNIRMAELAGKIRNAIKKVNPEIKFSVYSAYQSEYYKERYGIDWKYLADKIDLAMCGYGRNEKELKDTLIALGKTPLVCGELVYPYDEKSEEYPQYANKATLLRRATDATGGFLIYTLAELDGRTFYSIGEISRLISDCEEFFIEHKKDNTLVNVEGISMDDVVVFTSGRKRLIILINETDKEKEVKIENKKIELGMDVYDYYENKKLDDGKIIKCKVMPKDVKVFVVR